MAKIVLSFGDYTKGAIKECDLANYEDYIKDFSRLAKEKEKPVPEAQIKEAIKNDNYWDCQVKYVLHANQSKDGKAHQFRFILDSEMDLPSCTYRYYDESHHFAE